MSAPSDAAGSGGGIRYGPRHTGSLARRMMLIAAGWIFALLLLGGLALDRALTNLVSNQFDEQLEISLTSMVLSADLDPFGEVFFNRILGDQRFLEPNSGYYWQINGEGVAPLLSRSLWDLSLIHISEPTRPY